MAISDSLKKLQLKFVFRKDAEIGGNKFTLQVLSFKEEQKIQLLPTEGIDGIAYFNEMQKSMLAYAIRAVDGEEVPDIVEVTDQAGAKTTKERAIYLKEVLDGMPSALIERLFQVYVDMRDQKESEISSSLTYSWYKTPDQREEERRKKEEEAEEKAKAKARADAEKAAASEKKTDVPNPDADINLKKLPTDYSDEKGAKQP